MKKPHGLRKLSTVFLTALAVLVVSIVLVINTSILLKNQRELKALKASMAEVQEVMEKDRGAWEEQGYLNEAFTQMVGDYYGPTPTPKIVYRQVTPAQSSNQEKLKQIDQKIAETKAMLDDLKKKLPAEGYYNNPAYRDYVYILNQLEQERRLYE